MRARDIPNAISVLRIALVPPTVWLLLQERHVEALILFAVAGASDAVDGYLAKRFSWHSRAGAVLDPLADKLLMVACYVALAWLGHLPVWLAVVVVGRDIVIVMGALLYHLTVARVEMAPTPISKANTFMQIALIIAVLFSLALAPVPAVLLDVLIYTVLATTLLSGATYVWLWGTRARHRLRARVRQ